MPIVVNSKINYSDLKFHIGGGIGDSLKEMTITVPLQDYCDKTGKKIYVAYGGPNYNDCGWDELLRENIFDKSDCLEWVSDERYNSIKLPDARRYINNRFRNTFESYCPLKLKGDRIQIDKTKFNVGIQLRGNAPGKRWQLEKYNEVCNHLLAKNPDTVIYILDGPGIKINKNLFSDTRIKIMVDKSTLFQNIEILAEVDLFIGPDSFSKYVCSWYDKKQIILIHNVNHCTPRELLINHFPDKLLFSDNIKLVGIDYDENLNVSHISKDVKDIKVEEVINEL
jgi:hypothetical protein